MNTTTTTTTTVMGTANQKLIEQASDKVKSMGHEVLKVTVLGDNLIRIRTSQDKIYGGKFCRTFRLIDGLLEMKISTIGWHTFKH